MLGAKLGASAGIALGAWFSSGKGKKMAEEDAKKKLSTNKTTAGPRNRLQKSNINESVTTNLASTTNTTDSDSKNANAQYNTAGNDNSNVVTEQQTTNKLLKRLVQQSQ